MSIKYEKSNVEGLPMLNCLIVVPSLARAGAETQAVDLANGLAANGHSVHLFCFEPNRDQEGRVAEAVSCHFGQRKGTLDLSIVARLAEIIDREKIDVMQGVMQFASLIAYLASRRSMRKPIVLAAIHTTVNRSRKDEIQDRLIYRWLLRRLPAVVFVCNNQRDHWLRKYKELESNSSVVYNGVEPENFRREQFLETAYKIRRELRIPETAIMFACIAAFRPEKGHDILVEAFSRIREDAYLVFAGDGDLRASTESNLIGRGLQERSRFLGNIGDTRPLIVASNATVLASTAVETFSMAMLESMALGVPMIAPRIGGLPEAIVHEKTGFLFPIGDTDRLLKCMETVVSNPMLAMQIGQHAREKILQTFTRDKMVASTEELMRKVAVAHEPKKCEREMQ